MAGAGLLVILGGLVITQVLFGQAFERLNVKAAITGAGTPAGAQPSSDTGGVTGALPASSSGQLPAGTMAA